MPLTNQDLDQWLARVQQCQSRAQVFQLLDEFRPLDWTDEQRAMMGKTYIRLLEDRLKQQSEEAKTSDKKGGDDGPVWYEKM